jgi:dihydroneopterin aldolase/2-amino-4-hydroxy-6-hydroxymethyldihydropteridine diphosphokinase/dihydropteroate synthase
MNLHPTLIPLVASSDTMASLGVNYSSVSKTIYANLSSREKTFVKPEEVMEVAAGVALAIDCVESVDVKLRLPRAVLHAQEVIYGGTWPRKGAVEKRICEIRDLRVSTVVGLHPHERGERQRLEVDLQVKFEGGFGGWEYKAFQDIAMAVSLILPLFLCTRMRRRNEKYEGEWG